MDELIRRHEQMVYPAVRMLAEKAGGSGTILYSAKDSKGQVRTFVIGCHHVVTDLIKVADEWNPRLGRMMKMERRNPAVVETFRYNNTSTCIGVTGAEGDVVAYGARDDIALLELRDHENLYPYVAKIVPRDRHTDILLTAKVWAVGAALLHAPIVTEGLLNYKDDIIEGERYWMSSAQIIFGNSGGSMYWQAQDGDYYFIGMPARIAITMTGYSANPITHLGFFISPERIYKFLDEQDFQFLYDPAQTIEESDARREEKARQDRERMELMQGIVERGSKVA